MDPDVVQALPNLVEAGIVPAAAAPRLGRVAAGTLVSVHAELRATLYCGVLVFTSGIGLLLKENLDRIGPLTIALGLALLALGALAWVWHVAPPFSWVRVPSPNLAFDYVLLLTLLLVAADLGYCEHTFGMLGRFAPLELLLVSVLAGCAALRFDSRLIFSCALTSFAGWRGISLARAASALWSADSLVRWNAIGCGALFVVLGFAMARSGRKAHFEPVAAHLGWLLILGAMGSGIESRMWAGALLLTGAALAAFSLRARRFPLFAYGVIAAYVAVLRLGTALVLPGELGCLLVAASAIGVLALLLLAYRRVKGGEE